MGILDEAIREHLELKRKHGADEADVQRLADEAFGPPSRPGEPDFPEPEAEDAAAAGAPPALEEAPEDADGGAVAAQEDEALAELGAEDEAAEAAFEEPPEEAGGPAPGVAAEEPPVAGEPPAAIDPETDEEEAVFFDRDVEDALDLGELDLSLDDEGESRGGDEASAELLEPEEAGGEPPIESLPTEEHHLEDIEEEAEAGEDVLADTPDFLRDAPEDDELWFEQGEPKDFDFDE